jgi:transcriptional regulator with XRE-family HTH domain
VKKISKNLYFSLDKQEVYGIIRRVKDIERQLKQAIRDSGMSRYRIAKKSGLTESQLSYFVNGKRSLTLPAAAKLAKALGLELGPALKKGR